MTMLPNYILSAVFVVFLIHSYINKKSRPEGRLDRRAEVNKR